MTVLTNLLVDACQPKNSIFTSPEELCKRRSSHPTELLKTAFFVKTSDSNNFSVSIGYADFHHQKAFDDENPVVCQALLCNINVEATSKSCGTVQPDVVDNALTNTVNHGTRAGLKNSAQL